LLVAPRVMRPLLLLAGLALCATQVVGFQARPHRHHTHGHHGHGHAHAQVDAPTPSYPDCSSDAPLGKFAICNPDLDWLTRVTDLLTHMNVTEKVSWLGNGSPAIPRLGIPSYQWWSEALHGVAFSPGVNYDGAVNATTCFPEPIGIASAFDRKLVRSVADVVSTEARAMNNLGQAGLTFFTPNINIFRDPRWGRGQETPGEDPYLTSAYVYELIMGLQGGIDDRYLKIIADAKHFAAYDVEDWHYHPRYKFDAVVTDQDMTESFLPPFETSIRDAGVASIMCSYNAVNGVPSCGNSYLLQELARDDWNLRGFVVSDCDAVSDIYKSHNYTNSWSETVAVALKAGTDNNCGSSLPQHTMDAINDGSVTEADVDRALTRSIAR